MSGNKKEREASEVKSILSDLYNELSKAEYEQRYHALNQTLLADYQRIEKGSNVGHIANELVKQLNHEVLTNLRLNVQNPTSLKTALAALNNHVPRDERVFSNYAQSFPIRW
ncbi:bacteriocin immunity protein [Weissella minor]|uniref:bacteriocin immunity protein n=1 Tax=Weissella minor TaxID=1620 RepID=UPI001BAF66C3|nr:bacteriocin immunity protein [Weissella minor]MBS0949292.1 bacteriocin immunity protein [Weissella minor]